MQIFITLDYELFFLEPAEEIDDCLIRSTQWFLNILERHNAKAVFFVDAGYLYALQRQKHLYKKLEADYNKIIDQLQLLEKQGHEIGLHIHPHWEDSFYDGEKWKMNLSRFKLADFSGSDAGKIFKKYYEVLQPFSTKKIISYRAGGWCLEPFKNIRQAMLDCGIYIDSTVYPDGYSNTATHKFDFRQYPKKEIWTFDKEPAIETRNGHFTEIPFAANRLPPTMYWKVMADRIIQKSRKTGNGQGVKPSVKEVIKKLFLKTTDAVSIDAYKSDQLLEAFKRKEKNGGNYFCVIGHPKCFTERTYENLERFLAHAKEQGHSVTSFTETFQKTPTQLIHSH
jgi:hypothetical protein